MRPNYKIVVIIFFILAFTACDVLINKNIEDELIMLLSPPDNLNATMRQFTFWWEELDEANEYSLQIVSPSFDFIQTLFLDTLVVSNKFDVTLPPGVYQWRVRGENAKNETAWFTRNLTIAISDTLDNQQVVLVSPIDNAITSQSAITFKWLTIEAADDYLLEIRDNNNTLVTNPQILAVDSFEFAFAEGTYTWQVQARNSVSQTPFSTRTLTIDTTSPGMPTLISPPQGDTVLGGNVTFVWNRGTDNTVIDFDSIFIYSDSLFSLEAAFESSNTNYSAAFNQGIFFWRVKSYDRASNSSPFSTPRKFVIP